MSGEEHHELRKKKVPSCVQHIGDFANVLKAFIGSNYLTIPFAFKQSGLVLGIVGLLVIASLTDYCCHLIVRCKYICIRKIIANYREQMEACDESVNEEDERALRKRLFKNLSYGDIGRLAFGKVGLILVNSFIIFTQFGFCISYFIFVGNTVHQMFPTIETTPHNISVPWTNLSMVEDDTFYLDRYERYVRDSKNLDLGFVVPDILNNSYNLTEHTSMFPYSGVTKHPLSPGLYPSIDNGSIEDDVSLSDLHTEYEAVETTTEVTMQTAETIADVTTDATTADTRTMPANITTTSAVITSSWEPIHDKDDIYIPNLILLILLPLPVFLAFSLIRKIRHFGFVSVLADIFIFIGCCCVLTYLGMNFKGLAHISLAHFSTFPIFVGAVASSFEGIGTIIPIESSMEGNHHNFPAFLHGAIGILSAILAIFGIVSYLEFGDRVQQMINLNICPAEHPIARVVNLTLIMGILFTFPLQMFPVIELVESYIFAEGRICGPSLTMRDLEYEESSGNMITSTEDDMDEEDLLVNQKHMEMPVAVSISNTVPAWKRNILRMLLIFFACGVAMLCRDIYAYASAFVGALGSTMLAVTLPCLFYLRLNGSQMNMCQKAKDVLFLSLGIIAAAVSVYSIIGGIISHGNQPGKWKC